MLQESISDSAEFSGIAVSMKIFCDPSTVTVEKELLALTYGLDNNHLKIFLAFASPAHCAAPAINTALISDQTAG